MRKILFSVFAGGIILFGCSKSSDKPASIVGTWNASKIVELTYTNNTLSGGDTITTGNLVFGSDGTLSSTDSSGTTTGTYTYNSSTKALVIVIWTRLTLLLPVLHQVICILMPAKVKNLAVFQLK